MQWKTLLTWWLHSCDPTWQGPWIALCPIWSQRIPKAHLICTRLELSIARLEYYAVQYSEWGLDGLDISVRWFSHWGQPCPQQKPHSSAQGGFSCIPDICRRKRLFPTCPVRGSRFYQDCFRPLLLLLLLLPTSSPSFPSPPSSASSPSSPSPLAASGYALNCERPISVGTARPQPLSVGTAGPQPRLSGHCWTSTARARSQWALRDLNCEGKMSHRMSDRMPEEMSDRMPDKMSEYMPDRMPDRMSEYMSDGMLYR